MRSTGRFRPCALRRDNVSFSGGVSMKRAFQALALALTVALMPAPAFAQKPSLNDPASLKEQAPATYRVRFDTSAGPVVVTVTRAWAPRGADRFYNLVSNGYFDGARFFR